ncbi:MAG TPA: hypothetical protein VFB87_10555 [Gaiellaceae bacterium]|nr:hypothetical protein [Gaiellaceae bacterium]
MRKAVVLSLLAAALLAGCGGDDGPPSATDWADDLCSALGDWTDSLTSAAQSVTEEPSRESVESAVDDVEGATQKLVDDVDDLETPDLESGQQAEQSVDELSDSLSAEVEKVKETAENATLGNISESVTAISQSFTAMRQQISAAFTELEGLDPGGELRTAFEEADSCSELQTG